MAIQLAGYMHLIDPFSSLWETVSKGITGPVTFLFRIRKAGWWIKSDMIIAHPQCSSKEIANVPKRSKRNAQRQIILGNGCTSSIINRNDFVSK